LAPDLKSEIFIFELIAQLVTAINEMDHVHRLIDVSWQTKIRQQDLEQRALENERRAIEDARREVDEKVCSLFTMLKSSKKSISQKLLRSQER